MSWHYLPELVGASSEHTFWGGDPYARSKSTRTAERCYCAGRLTACYPCSRSGTTSEPLTRSGGVAAWMWSLQASRARHSAAQLEGGTPLQTCGLRLSESSSRSRRNGPSWKTCPLRLSMRLRVGWSPWRTQRNAFPFPRQTWVRTTYGGDIGWLHTPTHTANYTAPSMQKWPNCRAYKRVFGKPHPWNHEYLMGWPAGWSDLRRLEMDKFRLWLEQHGKPCVDKSAKAAD